MALAATEGFHVLKLPVTACGRALLRDYSKTCDVWSMAVDWDVMGEVLDDLVEYERQQEIELQGYHDWCIATGRGAPW